MLSYRISIKIFTDKPMLLNILKAFLLIFLLLAAGLYILFSPTHLTTVYYKGNIRIERDQYSIPTLYVSSIEQYLYALGTVEAQDRLFQIAFRSYASQGRLSQFLGEKTLPFDRYMRELNFKGWGEKRAQRFKKQNATQYEKFEAMVKGVNERVAKMLVLPMQFYLTGMRWQNFTINHLFYLAVQFEWGVSMNMVDQYTRSALLSNHTIQEINWILPNQKQYWAFQSIPIVTGDEIPSQVRTENVKDRLQKIRFNPLSVDRIIELQIIQFFSNSFEASNCWAVAGKYTESGLPLMSTDPHLENIVPGQWYQFIINYKDQNGKTAYSAGGTNPGSPHAYGKTKYFATGYSVSHGDNQDLYRQKIEGNRYLVDGNWRDLRIRNETILVKTGEGLRQDYYQVRQTHRGPIIHYIFGVFGSYSLQNDTISLVWTGFNNQWQSFINLTYIFLIDNLADLQNAMQNQTKTFLNVNVIAITADNHILMQQSGLHPIRRNTESGTYIKDGTTTQHDWVGIVPATDRMHIMDPPKGYILNANNKVAESEYYGGYLDYTIYTARADRLDQILREEIASGRKIGADFVKKVFMDTVDVYCRQILPQIVSVVTEAKIISNFDCNFSAQSTLATVYQVFMFELYHLIKPMSPQKMSLITFHQMQQGIYNYIHFAFRGDENKQKVMKDAWNRALVHLQSHFKTMDISKWKWGLFHVDTNQHVPFRNHPLLSRVFNLQFPGCGNGHTPNVGRMQQLQFGDFRATHRANSRAIYGYGGDHLSWFVIDTGASENILSKHYSDQHKLTQRGEMIQMIVGERGEQSSEDL